MVEHLFPGHDLPGLGASGPPEPLGPEPPELVLDGPGGPHALGRPDVDSDADGRPDTVLADTADGLLLATDLDADGHVDVTTLVGAAVPGPVWDPGWDAPAPPAPVLDPVNGRWAGMV